MDLVVPPVAAVTKQRVATTITDDDEDGFDLLSDEELAEFISVMEQVVGPQWELSPKQEFAEALWCKVDWMLWGGAAGGGKSEFACWHANRLSEEIDGHVTLLLRQTIPELRRSLIIRLIARIRQYDLPAKYRKLDGQSAFHYRNGSLIECGFLKTDEHLGNYLSAEYGCIIVDEATQLTPDQVIQIAARLRVTREAASRGARPHLGLFTNPGDVGHAWLYELFVVPSEYGNKVVVWNIANGLEAEHRFVVRTYDLPQWGREDGTVGSMADASPDEIDRYLIPWVETVDFEVDPINELCLAFVPSRATDNPFIEPTYLKMLNTLPEMRRRQLRDGDWDTFTGQFFYEWRRDVHVVDPFDIPESWVRARGVDYGSTNPWAMLFAAWDEDGNCYVYDELYGGGLTPEQQAKAAKDRATRTTLDGRTRVERYAATVADPAVFSNHRGAGRSIADLWVAAGLRVTRAKNARVAGWANVRQYLWDPEAQAPRLFVFRTCTNLIRTIPLMQTDDKNPEDIDTDLEDHDLDALRYVLAWRPRGVRERVKDVGKSMDQRFQAMLAKRGKQRPQRTPWWGQQSDKEIG